MGFERAMEIGNEPQGQIQSAVERDTAAELTATGSSGDPALECRVLRALGQAFDIWRVRHRKYGRGNISRHGATGCCVRLADKLARLDNRYMVSGRAAESFADESITDTWIDAINYAVMGLMCHQGEWDKPDGS